MRFANATLPDGRSGMGVAVQGGRIVEVTPGLAPAAAPAHSAYARSHAANGGAARRLGGVHGSAESAAKAPGPPPLPPTTKGGRR